MEKKVEHRTLELVQVNKQLKELNNEKNRFLGIAAQDLRNPIGTALSFADLLIEAYDTIPDTDKKKHLKLILERCEFSLKLLNNLLDISKIEAGKIELDLQINNYKEFIKEVIALNQTLASRKQILLKLEWNSPETHFKFDRNKIEQVLNNLINNAIKYSLPKKEVIIKVEMENMGVKTSVHDQGAGISEKELNLLFQPFQKVSSKPTGDETSTGLGLAIVKKIVEEHLGTIDVQSEVGVGSCFSYTIPITL
jgi:signal transduction histidine kinase